MQFRGFYGAGSVRVVTIKGSFPLLYVGPQLLEFLDVDGAWVVFVKNTCE